MKHLVIVVVYANKSLFVLILLLPVVNISAQGLSERNSALDMLCSLHF